MTLERYRTRLPPRKRRVMAKDNFHRPDRGINLPNPHLLLCSGQSGKFA
jgi:hypothetical protein